ncbi:uncharacterized protein LOC131166509 [Malania oleifera]|uniref:uncharacterized protein LOC131166509 n=1 Tax=Malania oleifera TaxID=397392 RepID=UPI0025AE34E9|nr:uncharacterized protein LOC131166509 [Malania oleifera]
MEGDTKGSARGGEGSAKKDPVGSHPGPNALSVHQGSFTQGMTYTNSQLQLELPTLQLLLIRVGTPDSSDTTGDAGCPVDNNRQSADSEATGDNCCAVDNNLQTACDSDESSCQTPASEEQKIPAILSCASAPRSQKTH